MSLSREDLLTLLEEKKITLQKTQINLRKCPKQRLTKGYIETRIKSIEEDWQSFKTDHQSLLKCTHKEERAGMQYFINEDYYRVEELYLSLTGDLKDMLMTFTQTKDTSSEQSVMPQVKLPHIKLPTLTGKYEEWPTFNDLFLSLVHHNTTLTKVQKLHYLKSSVAGEAEALLKHINVTDSNYEPAWEILRQRYGNKRLIINSLLKRLFGQKKITTATANQIKGLLDTTTECLNSLQNLQVCTDSWDPMIIYIVIQRLDVETHKAWEDNAYSPDSDQLPTWQELKNFLEGKFRTLELITPMSVTRENRPAKERSFHASAPAPTKICIICNEDHTLCHCKEFTKLSPMERSKFVKEKNLCFNCLIPGHSALKCRLRVSCKVCHKRHHSLLHQTQYTNQSDNLQTHHNQVNEEDENTQDTAISSHIATKKSTALLATALIPVRDDNGYTTILRALIDQGSQANFISERVTQTLKLKRQLARGTVTGVGSTLTEVNQMVQLQLLSRYDENFQLTVNSYVMPKRVTTKLPSKSFMKLTHAWPQLEDLFLADPSFNRPGRVDLLLGVEVYSEILRNNLIKGPPGSPCAQETSFGWILFGQIQPYPLENMVVMHHQVDFDNILQKLWEIDSDNRKKLTKEEETCQKLYEDTYKRNNEGRFIVKLPFKNEPPKSVEGKTRDIAKKRLLQLEKRLERNTDLRIEYNKIMKEYITLKHMEEIPENELGKPSVYLPHHPVIKETSSTTKVRVVFNASSPGTNHISLNDDLLIGPQLQEDIRSLVMRWRLRQIGFVSDIEKMYRQVLVTKEDTDYQRILWRDDPNLPIKDYRLLRLTFGTASAPYLAVRTLQQMAEEENKMYPEAAKIIKRDFYMDDLITGQDTVDEAIDVARNIATILERGGYILQKWASNSIEFQKEFSPKEIPSNVKIHMNVGETVRTLGLSWNLEEDKLKYNCNLPEPHETITKRNVLAEIQHLFDPLGWLSPALLPAKCLLQKLWLKGVTWDEILQPETEKEWLDVRHSLKNITDVQVDRWLYTTNKTFPNTTIHGFCDASTKAYGAVAYIRVKTGDGQYKVGIIAAKSRVAPIKPVSLPRLELCGAVLLSKLLKQIGEAMDIPIQNIFAWTDSTIVLSWLRGDPGRWQTFVRNRVVTILDNVGHKWYHVNSQENPADIASRGMLLPELERSSIWWQGPSWLSHKEIVMHESGDEFVDLEKRKNIKVNINIVEQETEEKSILTQFEDFDTLTDLIRTIAYCKRFLNYKKHKQDQQPQPMTTDELNEAMEDCVRIVQTQDFSKEINNWKERKSINHRSPIKKLNPFVDHKNILRVGGRLRHAHMAENTKHPIILTTKNPLAKLIVVEAHKKTLHGGIQLTMNYVRSRFWITRLKNLVSSTVHKCIICARNRAKSRNQIMGDLPEARVKPARPFLNSGVDFAGPLQILRSKGRGSKLEKGYICIFVCMATKALHLELVGDLSTNSFMGAFKRFVARRGRCSHIWSDRGTNFVGASKVLQDMWTETKLALPENIVNLLAEDGTQWHFNPPYSPNFGGLWESLVRSTKNHLKRILTKNLTFEEMSTTLCQIEACLNSRPLCPIDNSDPENMDILTPGRFLIGEATFNIPEPNLMEVNWTRLSRWQYTQKLVQDFWHRWQNEYLTGLQQRPKWRSLKQEFQIGDVVLIKENNIPPGKWALGRVTEKHLGADDVCRVYSLKSGSKIIKRSITKLCELPINS